jgi:hypothetical protein
MEDDVKQPAEVVQPNLGHRFPVGHPRYSGRKKRTAQQAREMAAEMGIDPLQFLMQIIKSDTIEQTIVEDGKKKKRVAVSIPLEMRVDAAKWVSRFCYPTLSATQVTGADEGPVRTSSFKLDVGAILANPKLADAAQDLAMYIVEQQIGPDPVPLNHPSRYLPD